ncbi:hypothetical protein Niako_4147 [Niastella koreensis GR20-10]|uniref:Uncharacterized protein n=1 Tax=Niastella koreensis (strain DSM 17620 / KACC 11465 / NBRC 106392 / GR20-10) TaxID=700598 RepID=G8TDH3_NIAKG|nr:hypothetical protein Niako_4147 [Niastella koreensis GR20-10]
MKGWYLASMATRTNIMVSNANLSNNRNEVEFSNGANRSVFIAE